MVRTIFERYSQGGMSQRGIAAELNGAGMLRADANPWTGKQIGRILDNPAYVGRCVLDDELVAGNWEPIIDLRTWEQARAVRASDKRRTSLLRAAKGGPYLLSGMLFCGHCDRKLVHRATHNGQRDGIYVCIEPGGKWCPGGSIASARADESCILLIPRAGLESLAAHLRTSPLVTIVTSVESIVVDHTTDTQAEWSVPEHIDTHVEQFQHCLAFLERHVRHAPVRRLRQFPQSLHALALGCCIGGPRLELRTVSTQGFEFFGERSSCDLQRTDVEPALESFGVGVRHRLLQCRDLRLGDCQLVLLHPHLLASQPEIVTSETHEAIRLAEDGRDLVPHQRLDVVGLEPHSVDAADVATLVASSPAQVFTTSSTAVLAVSPDELLTARAV